MNRTQLELDPGVVLDARRALWLATERTLVVSDLHLGYAWTHRQSGQLLPLTVPDDTLSRLESLVAEFAPEQLVVLGDVVHGECDIAAIREKLHILIDGIGARTRLRLVEGNHDFALARFLRKRTGAPRMEEQIECGPHTLLHGHTLGEQQPAAMLEAARRRGGRLIFGHEHPAVRLSDGVTTSARCPCFVVASGALILPAFTQWSAGGNVRSGMLSPLGQVLVLERNIAVIAGKLLPIPLGNLQCESLG